MSQTREMSSSTVYDVPAKSRPWFGRCLKALATIFSAVANIESRWLNFLGAKLNFTATATIASDTSPAFFFGQQFYWHLLLLTKN
ncbi:MAG: hypothetical protein PHF42_05170 [Pseudomonas sp.]|nr:hypothetical protein [Pseudomonas sp.]